jgi:hypothetical protein
VQFICVANSNTTSIALGASLPLSQCRGLNTITVNMTNVQIQQNANGYWGCAGVDNLARAYGKTSTIFLDISGNPVCKASDVITKPADWNGVTEGIPLRNDERNTSQICDVAKGNTDCIQCFQDGGTWTAIGCIKTDPNDFLKNILGLGIGIDGGIAFLLILFGGLQIMTSAEIRSN